MTETVQIRRARPGDAAFFHGVRSEPSAGEFQPLRSYSEGQLRKVIQRRSTMPLDRHLDGKVQWVILADDRPAGWISLDVTNRDHGIGTIGYTVSEAFRGHGVASRALRLVVDIAFAQSLIDLDRLEAVVAAENIASQRVLENAGFAREGTARGLLRIRGKRIDHYRYSLLRADHFADAAGHVDSSGKDISTS